MDLSARWVRTLYVSLLIGVAIITASLFFVVSTLNRQNSEDRSEYRQSLIWYTAQLGVEYQDLMHALNKMIVHDGASEHTGEVTARFDILWSRAMRLGEGEAGQELVRVNGSVPLMGDLEAVLRAADPLMPAIARAMSRPRASCAATSSACRRPSIPSAPRSTGCSSMLLRASARRCSAR